MRKIDLFDFFAGQMQELALVDGNDLQMGLEQRIILRSQCGQETIASMLVLICTHIRLTLSTIPRWLVGPLGDETIAEHAANPKGYLYSLRPNEVEDRRDR